MQNNISPATQFNRPLPILNPDPLFNHPQSNHIPSYFAVPKSKLKQLEDLLVKQNYSDKIKNKILMAYTQTLTELDLSSCKLKHVPGQILEFLPHLTKLNLSDNQLSQLDDKSFAGVPNLQQLDLSFNQLDELPAKIFANLTGLHELNLSCNKINLLHPTSFAGLINLQYLELSFNQLSELPPQSFEDLTNLHELNLMRNVLRQLHTQSFAGLSGLRKLDLSKNKLAELPANCFADLINLHELDLFFNQIRTIQNQSWAGLTSLRTLDLTQNKITFIAQAAWVNLTTIVEIKLDGNQIHQLPTSALGKGILGRILASDKKLSQAIRFDEDTLTVNQEQLIQYYIEHASQSNESVTLCQEYCLALLKANQLIEPEALELLSKAIYQGGIKPEQVGEDLAWYADLFSRTNLPLLPFLQQQWQRFTEQELAQVIYDYQLFLPPSRAMLTDQLGQQLSAALIKVELNFDQAVFKSELLPEFQHGIMNSVNDEIKGQIMQAWQLHANGLALSPEQLTRLFQAVCWHDINHPEHRELGIKSALRQIIHEETQEGQISSLTKVLAQLNQGQLLQAKLTGFANYVCHGLTNAPDKVDKFIQVVKPYLNWQQALDDLKMTRFQELGQQALSSGKTFETNPMVFSPYILNILPYLSYPDLVQLMQLGLTPACKRQLEAVDAYCSTIAWDPASLESLNLIVVGGKQHEVLLSIAEPLHLNPVNDSEFKLTDFTLLNLTTKLVNGEQLMCFPSQELTLQNFQSIELPLYLARLIKTKFCAANLVASKVYTAINIMLAPFPITTVIKVRLEGICYQAAQRLGQDIELELAFKQYLMQACHDAALLDGSKDEGTPGGEFNQLMLAVAAAQEQIKEPQQCLLMLAKQILAKAKTFAFYGQVSSLLTSLTYDLGQLDDLRAGLKTAEVAYILGVYFLNLSSLNVLGYHQGQQNIAFNRFRLLGAVYLALAVEAKDNTYSKAERKAISQEINQAVLTDECSGQITNRLYGMYTTALNKVYLRSKAILAASIS